MLRRPLLCSFAFVGALAACGEEDRARTLGSPHRDSVTTSIGPEGGLVSLEGGPEIGVPAGALVAPTELSIEELSLSTLPPPPDTLIFAGRAFAFKPHGQTFDQPITITLPVSATVDGIAVVRLDDENDGDWEAVPSVGRDGTSAIFESSHFSVYCAAQGPGTVTDGDASTGDSGQDPLADGGRDGGTTDGASDGGDASFDAGPTDGGVSDGGDAGFDGGPADGGTADGGVSDGGDASVDAGPTDGGVSDGGVSDGSFDGGASDGGPTDAGFDGGTTDGAVDGGVSDASDGAVDGGAADGSIGD